MWIEETKTGKYKYFERYKDPYSEKWKKVSVTLDKKSPQAKRQAIVLLQEKIDEKVNSKNTEQITFHELVRDFEKIHARGIKESTRINRQLNLNTILSMIPKDYLIQNIDRRFLQKLFDQLIDKGYSLGTIRQIKSYVNQSLKYAVRMGYIPGNELQYVELPKQIKTDDEVEKTKSKYLDREEYLQFIAYLDREAPKNKHRPRYVRAIKVLYLTGMRFGELAALELNSVDFDNKTIAIRQSFSTISNKVTSPKTKKSIRTITVSDSTLEIIKEQVEENIIRGTNGQFIFGNPEPMKLKTFNRFLDKSRKSAGLDKQITSHFFRHSHISLLVELGTPIPLIMDRVGHSDSKVTMEIYSHVTKRMNDDLIDKLNDIFAPSMPPSD
ncbi:tyrosine-type recombinase/integrase [Streptococcus danieliae]|uniref:tyrosine-type recombinase/integrase n=1 Tax=Streptococcus danieliae TaxID=747656 RepID=UPI0021CA2F22|nr:site-specific integrase [Streptococcus danieliae]MCU0082239.1 site-specific integrase [Streptococcus danieliae]